MVQNVTDILVCVMLGTINALFLAIWYRLGILVENLKAAARHFDR